MLSTQDTQNLEEQEEFLIQISVSRSRLVIVDSLAQLLGLDRNGLIQTAFMMGIGALCQPANSFDVRARFIARD